MATLVAGLRNLGIDAEEWPDGFTVRGAGAPRGGIASAHDDHRIAMTLAIAALGAQEPSHIDGAESVAISYPGFCLKKKRIKRCWQRMQASDMPSVARWVVARDLVAG